MHAFWLTILIAAIAVPREHDLRRRLRAGDRAAAASAARARSTASSTCRSRSRRSSSASRSSSSTAATAGSAAGCPTTAIQVIFALPGDGAGDDLRLAAVRRPRGRPGAARDRRRAGAGGLRRSAPRAWQTFWRVTLPAIRWGVAYGVVLTTARALGEYGAVARRLRAASPADRDAHAPRRRALRGASTWSARTRPRSCSRCSPSSRCSLMTVFQRKEAKDLMAIAVRKVTKRFGDFVALDDVSRRRRRRLADRAARAERQRQVDAAAGHRRARAARRGRGPHLGRGRHRRSRRRSAASASSSSTTRPSST